MGYLTHGDDDNESQSNYHKHARESEDTNMNNINKDAWGIPAMPSASSLSAPVPVPSTEEEHRDMVYRLKKSGEAILATLTPEKCDLWHMATGVSGEVGELTDAIKKAVAYNKPLDIKNVIEELGDVEFYLEGIRQNLGITRAVTIGHNINKLLKGKDARYAKGTYSDEQAQARADKVAEGEIAEHKAVQLVNEIVNLIVPPVQVCDDPVPPVYKPQRKRILILGHGRHGKDTVAEMLAKLTGLTFMSSSWFAASRILYPAMSDEYENVDACFADRSNKRVKCFELIKAYNSPDATRLATELLEEADIYVGMRSNAEYQACMQKGLFDLVLWVDASHRAPLESVTSFNINYDPAKMIKIDNNGGKDMLDYELRYKLRAVLDCTPA